MKVQDFIDQTIVTKYFILDTHDTGKSGQNGVVFADEDYVQYSYSPRQNNKLAVHSAFLYRKPGKEFRIVGGGFIDAISPVENSAFNTAFISHGFMLSDPLVKGDPFLENFVWKGKIKPGVGWRGFWTNYGILEISAEDFWGLLAFSDCVPGISVSAQAREIIEDNELMHSVNASVLSVSADPVVNTMPKAKPSAVTARSTVYPRDRHVAQNALNNARHKCEIDSSHPSFLRKGAPVLYAEPHHLVPMAFQSGFTNSLDIEENIVALCSNCHNQIHYGSGAEVLIKQLYNNRKADLKRVGIDIDLDTLLAMYKL